MNPFLALLILVVCVALGVGAMLLARRWAPEGSHINNGDPATGVFGVLATGFALLLGLVIVLAFNSYDQSRNGAEDEADLVVQQHEIALLLPEALQDELSGELVCYARHVVHQEWPRMEAGTQRDSLNPWAVELFRSMRPYEPTSEADQSAYEKWLDQTSEREDARGDRLHGSAGVIPLPLWIVLLSSAALIVVFMLIFADSAEHPVIQGILVGTVIVVVVSSLLLIAILDRPFDSGFDGIRPTAMTRAVDLLEKERVVANVAAPIPCTATGLPL